MEGTTQAANQGCNSFLPLLPRLDRLECLIELIVERHSIPPSCHAQKMAVMDQCKTISSALEEVRQNGSILDRLNSLEQRVLQLGLELDARTSKSTSTGEVFQKSVEHDLEQQITKNLQESEPGRTSKNKGDPSISQALSGDVKQQNGVKGGRWTKKARIFPHRKWIGCFEAED